MKIVVLFVAIPLALYLGACVLLFARQRSLLYMPTAEVCSPQAESFRLEGAGETLKIWHVNPDRASAILYFGGNGEDVAQNIPDFLEIFPATTIYLANYRGYGGSSGAPSEQALFADAVRLFDHVRAQHDRISVIGRSLGTGVSIHLAGERPVKRMILVTPYDSIESIARKAFPIFPIGWLLKDRYRSIDRAAQIEIPTLALVAAEDQVVRRMHSGRLIAAFDARFIEEIVIPYAGHNTIGTYPEYREALVRFLGEEAPP